MAPATIELQNKLAQILNVHQVGEAWIGLTTGNDVNPSTNPKDWFWVNTGKTPSYDAWPAPKDQNGACTYPDPKHSNCVSLNTGPKTWQNDGCTGVYKTCVCEVTHVADDDGDTVGKSSKSSKSSLLMRPRP